MFLSFGFGPNLSALNSKKQSPDKKGCGRIGFNDGPPGTELSCPGDLLSPLNKQGFRKWNFPVSGKTGEHWNMPMDKNVDKWMGKGIFAFGLVHAI